MKNRPKKKCVYITPFSALLPTEFHTYNGQSCAESIYVRRCGLKPCWELMNVVICRVRVFDFSKPLQGTSPTLIGPRGRYGGIKKKKKGYTILYETEKGFREAKNARVGEKRANEKGRLIKKNPFCWLRNKTDRVILRHFWQN